MIDILQWAAIAVLVAWRVGEALYGVWWRRWGVYRSVDHLLRQLDRAAAAKASREQKA